MKLFVWVDPYPVSYGSSGLFVVAEDEDHARRLARSGKCYSYVQFEQEGGSWRDDLAMKLGPPDRIVDLPCAEWHEWSE